jgi:colanic acid/amylovoran biosynthesis glycosyltransferase
MNLISMLKLETKVILHGYRPYRYFLDLAYECDAYIQASKTAKDNDKEGTPMAIIDVMATGLPVIATRHSDIPETVDDGVTGFLATENHVEDLAEALRKFTLMRNDVSIMSKKCRLKIENDFNISKQVDKLEKLYSAII